jgi:hypothetical protein
VTREPSAVIIARDRRPPQPPRIDMAPALALVLAKSCKALVRLSILLPSGISFPPSKRSMASRHWGEAWIPPLTSAH